MADYIPSVVQRLITQFEKLPGVGAKSAARMAFHYIRANNNDALDLADSLRDMKETVVDCEKCFNISEEPICGICSSKLRDSKKLCVVEEPLDVVAFEKSNLYNGFYFVLGGVISPADGIGPEQLRFGEMKGRIQELIDEAGTEGKVEVIIATNPSIEGEATANHILTQLKLFIDGSKIKVTRLGICLLYTSPSPRDGATSRMPSSA